MTTPALPPPIGPRGLAYRAVLEGLNAGQGGMPVSACPYSRDRPFTRRAWLAGYTRGRELAGLRLPQLEADPDQEPRP